MTILSERGHEFTKTNDDANTAGEVMAVIHMRGVTRHRSIWIRHQKSLVPALLLVPGGLLFSVFVLYPILASIRLAFYEWNGVAPKTWVGLANFQDLLTDRVFYTAIGNNLIWLALIGMAPVMGLTIALLLNRASSGM